MNCTHSNTVRNTYSGRSRFNVRVGEDGSGISRAPSTPVFISVSPSATAGRRRFAPFGAGRSGGFRILKLNTAARLVLCRESSFTLQRIPIPFACFKCHIYALFLRTLKHIVLTYSCKSTPSPSPHHPSHLLASPCLLSLQWPITPASPMRLWFSRKVVQRCEWSLYETSSQTKR